MEGIVDVEGQNLLWSPFIDDSHIPLCSAMQAAFGVPASLSNDCVLIAEALRWKDPDRYGDNFAALLLSNGIGMGLYIHAGPSPHPLLGGRVRPHDLCAGGLALPLRPARLRGGLCRHLCDLAAGTRLSCDEVTDDEPPENGLRDIADRARAGEGIERQAFRDGGAGHRHRSCQPVHHRRSLSRRPGRPGAGTLDLMAEGILQRLKGAGFGEPFRGDMLDAYTDEVSLICEGGMMHSLIGLDSSLPDHSRPPRPSPGCGEGFGRAGKMLRTLLYISQA